MTGGIGGEIASLIAEHCFEHLDAPVKRVASLDTPVPFTSSLEDQFLPIDRFHLAISELLSY
jgi:2-oxoisovalerate dehydrogenase E1 component